MLHKLLLDSVHPIGVSLADAAANSSLIGSVGKAYPLYAQRTHEVDI